MPEDEDGDFPTGPDDEKKLTVAADLDSFPCPDCDDVADSKFRLGQHRYAKHGYRSGSSAKKRAAKGRGSQRRTRAPRQKKDTPASIVAEVETSIAEAMTKGAALAYPVAPIPAGYCIATGDEFAAIVARLAARNPKLLARLRMTSDVMDYFALGTWGVGLVVAVRVNSGQYPADGPLAAQWGIDEIAADYLAAQAAAAATEGTAEGVGDGSSVVGNGSGPEEAVEPSSVGTP